jgi:hypothetical protein
MDKHCHTTFPLLTNIPLMKSKYWYASSRLENARQEINWLELQPSKHDVLFRHLSSILSWFQRTIIAERTGKFLNANFKIQ